MTSDAVEDIMVFKIFVDLSVRQCGMVVSSPLVDGCKPEHEKSILPFSSH